MTETVVTRLYAAIERTQDNPSLANGIVVDYLDAIELRDLLAALCPTHGACTRCETVLCDDCGVGENSNSPDDVLCVECDDEQRAQAEDPDPVYLDDYRRGA